MLIFCRINLQTPFSCGARCNLSSAQSEFHSLGWGSFAFSSLVWLRIVSPRGAKMQEKLTASSQSSVLFCSCAAWTSKVNVRQVCSLRCVLEMLCRRFAWRALVSGSPGGQCTHIPGLPGPGLSNRSSGATITLGGVFYTPWAISDAF